MSRRFRVLRDLTFVVDATSRRTEVCSAGEIVSEASVETIVQGQSEFRRLLSGRKKDGEKRAIGARILFEWNGGFRTAEFGRDLELVTGEGWRS